MDKVKDIEDFRLDTPEAVKEALLAGADLYNPESGEFWWLYNVTDSIATTTIFPDDPNLLSVIDNPDFDLYEDIVGGLNYTGYITDSIETIIEDGEEDPPLIDPRDAVFEQIASEDGWVVATPENVRAAVQSHMAEKENDMTDKKSTPIEELKTFLIENPEAGTDEIIDTASGSLFGDSTLPTAELIMGLIEKIEQADVSDGDAWKEKNVLIDRNGDDALVMRNRSDGSREFVVAHGYDEETGHWEHGTYYDSVASAAADLEGRVISDAGEEVICPDFWYRADIESVLENAGLEVNDAKVNATLKELGFDNGWLNSNFHDRLAETGNEMIADAVNDIGPNGGGGGAPVADVDRGISLKAEAESMRRASQALSADGLVDEREPSFTPDLS